MDSIPKLGLLCVIIGLLHCSGGVVYTQPEQIHISYGRDPSQMVVTWSTLNNTLTPQVRYGPSLATLGNQASGTTNIFVDGGPEQRTEFIHRVTLKGLTPGQQYYYICGSQDGWSDPFHFTAMQDGTDWSPRLVVFGDLGKVNAQSLPRLQREVDLYDAVLHVGDFAYNLDDDNARVGDDFMNQIQSIAAYLPYMSCPGNHENKYNFSNYKNRFTMPFDEDSKSMFFSFDMGPAHIISLTTEYYFYVQYGFEQIIRQYEWLERDLKKASLPENRTKRPWIITIGHRPMYCSNTDHDDCTKDEDLVRVGIPFLHVGGLEHLFKKYGVDLALWAHEHTYERLWPVLNKRVYNGSDAQPYTNPKAPVHIVTGSAGCQENHDHFKSKPKKWSAFRNTDYGYTRMTIHNNTHISIQQVSDDQNGKVVDSVNLIKDTHGPYKTESGRSALTSDGMV